MILDILPLPNGGARLVRVYSGEPCAALPTELPDPAGAGSLRITELGDYCFSERPRCLPEVQELCRYALDAAGAPRLTMAFGQMQDISGWREAAQADESEQQLPPPLCGSFLEEVTLPDGLRVIGSCSFYNCRRLRRLSVGAGELTLGSDVFLNCFALETLVVRAQPEQKNGLFALVGNITEAVQALFWPEGTPAPLAGLWYPAYWEDIEETPAHILLHTFSGQGYHYRQCFLEGRLLPAEYDAIFRQGHDADDADHMALLCFDRLRWPWRLSGEAGEAYRTFLAANVDRVLARLLKEQDLEAVQALLALDVMDKAAFARGAALASRAENAAAAALLADAEHRKFAPAPKQKRYDLDF